jgi:protein-arginine kinase activator protein McsA
VIAEAGIPLDLIIDTNGETEEERKFIPIMEFDQAGKENPESSRALKRTRLKAELERLIQTEEYEKAAKIRDQLLLLDKSGDRGNP